MLILGVLDKKGKRGQRKLQHRVSKHKESQKTWRSSELMKKTRTHNGGGKDVKASWNKRKKKRRSQQKSKDTKY